MGNPHRPANLRKCLAQNLRQGLGWASRWNGQAISQTDPNTQVYTARCQVNP